MSTKVFIAGIRLECGHGASAQPLTSGAKLTVAGKAVVTATEIRAAVFPPGCSQTNTNAGQVICTRVLTVSGTESRKLTVASKPVIVETLSGTTNGVPKKTDLKGSAGQSRLIAS